MSTLSHSRWIFLLSLAALMFISVSEGLPFVPLPCLAPCDLNRIRNIQSCHEQRPRKGCRTHGFVVTTTDGRDFCIKGDSRWILNKIAKGEISCPPDISRPH